jgi:hypothetical protein
LGRHRVATVNYLTEGARMIGLEDNGDNQIDRWLPLSWLVRVPGLTCADWF